MNDGTTPLILAASVAVEGMVAELINCQADVNAVDDHGKDRDRFGFLPAEYASRGKIVTLSLKNYLMREDFTRRVVQYPKYSLVCD
jgi:hypothetical protein